MRDIERTLTLSVVLVILVVFLFLRNARATLIPSVAVPVSLITTFGAMYLAGLQPQQSLADGADHRYRVRRRRRDRRAGKHDSRHIEAGMPPKQAALQGAREVGFTVLSMSLSLIAVFIPILLMGGIVGRYSASSRSRCRWPSWCRWYCR